MTRIIINNAVVAEQIGDTLILVHREKNHCRTYVLSRDRLTVTVRGVTEEIVLPWIEKREAA